MTWADLLVVSALPGFVLGLLVCAVTAVAHVAGKSR